VEAALGFVELVVDFEVEVVALVEEVVAEVVDEEGCGA
jgi:hypothetical protein